MPMHKSFRGFPVPGWGGRPSRKIMTVMREEAAKFFESVPPALQALVGKNLLLVVPAAERPVYWILTETGSVNLEALRQVLPPGYIQLETVEVFREAVRKRDKPHLHALREHLYLIGNRRLLARLLEKNAR